MGSFTEKFWGEMLSLFVSVSKENKINIERI